MPKLVVDRNIPLAQDAFGPLGNLVLLSSREITPEHVRDADVLIVRSETNVNRSLLEGSRVKFVGTPTIGIDHVDKDYLRSAGVVLASAPGCNSNAVKEYVVAALLSLSVQQGRSLRGQSIGVVGVGNVGSKVAAAARALGMVVRENDPPLARSTGDRRFVPLDALMDCDVITLHVPLTRSGPDPTFHLFDEGRLGRMKRGAVLFNTSRGAVVETEALKRAILAGRISQTVIDVWENEPGIDTELLSMVTIGTPHIAGYSLEGKVEGVRMIRAALRRHYGLADAPWDPPPPPGTPAPVRVSASQTATSVERTLLQVVTQCCDIASDDRDLRRLLTAPPSGRGQYFSQLRSAYRVRREFPTATVLLANGDSSLAATLTALGFHWIKEQ